LILKQREIREQQQQRHEKRCHSIVEIFSPFISFNPQLYVLRYPFISPLEKKTKKEQRENEKDMHIKKRDHKDLKESKKNAVKKKIKRGRRVL